MDDDPVVVALGERVMTWGAPPGAPPDSTDATRSVSSWGSGGYGPPPGPGPSAYPPPGGYADGYPPAPAPFSAPVYAPHAAHAHAMVHAPPMSMATGFRCMFCGFSGYSLPKKKVAPAGWVVTVVLAFAFLPLFWIGLLIRDTKHQCPQCGGVQ